MPNVKRTYADLDAEVSGSDSGDENASDIVETEHDCKFIDDEPLEEGEVSPCVKIRRGERAVTADDVELVLENAGLRRATSRVERNRGSATVYKDSDEEGADSDDENFVVSDSDDDACRKATKMLREYRRSEGLFPGDKRSSRRPPKLPARRTVKPAASAVRAPAASCEEEDYDYGEPRRFARPPAPAPPPAPPAMPASRLPPLLAPIFKMCSEAKSKPVPAAAAPVRAGARVHPTPAKREPAPIFVNRAAAGKVAPVFDPAKRAAADKTAARWPGKRALVPAAKRAKPAEGAGSGKKAGREPVTNAVVVDRSTGLAYFVHEDGRRSPRQM